LHSQGQSPPDGLACRLALGTSLEAMVHRIPQQVNQRLADLLEKCAIQLDLPAVEREVNVLAQLAGCISHVAREPIEDDSCRHHSSREHFVLQVAQEAS